MQLQHWRRLASFAEGSPLSFPSPSHGGMAAKGKEERARDKREGEWL